MIKLFQSKSKNVHNDSEGMEPTRRHSPSRRNLKPEQEQEEKRQGSPLPPFYLDPKNLFK